MPQQNLDPELSDKAREAMNAAFDAIAECHNEVAAANQKVVAKIAEAARTLEWPDHIFSGMVNQMQSIAQMQLKMIDHTIEVWREQIKSWPGLTLGGHWPDVEALKAISVNPVRFWTRMGEQWQKNWAQTVMSEWTESSKRNAPRKSDDRE
jgi:hypothetical protein